MLQCDNVYVPISDPFPRGQWWVKLPKKAYQRRYRRDRQTCFAVKIAAIFLSRSVCTVTNKTIVSTSSFSRRNGYRVLSVRTLMTISDTFKKNA